MFSPDEIKEYRHLFDLSRRQPVNFAYCFGKKPEEDVFLLHKIKKPAILFRQAKEQAKSTKAVCGGISLESKTLSVRCESEAPGGIARRLKLLLRQLKLRFDIVIIGPDGEVVERDIAEDAVEASDGPVGQDSGAVGEPGAGRMPDEESFSEARQRLMEGITADLLAQLTDRQRAAMSARLREADGLASEGSFDLAGAAVDRLIADLDRVGAADDEQSNVVRMPVANDDRPEDPQRSYHDARQELVGLAKTEALAALSPEDRQAFSTALKHADEAARSGDWAGAAASLVDLRDKLEAAIEAPGLRPMWNRIWNIIEGQVSLLRREMRSIPDPEMQQLAGEVFDPLVGENRAILVDALERFDADPSADLAEEVMDAMEVLRELAAPGELLELFEKNPLMLEIDIRGTLNDCLDNLEAQMSKILSEAA